MKRYLRIRMIVKRVIRSLVWRWISILFVLGLWSDLQLKYFPLMSYLPLRINKSELTEYRWARSQGRSWKLLCFPLRNMTDENICHRCFHCAPCYFDLSIMKPNISSASRDPIYVRVVSLPPSFFLFTYKINNNKLINNNVINDNNTTTTTEIRKTAEFNLCQCKQNCVRNVLNG